MKKTLLTLLSGITIVFANAQSPLLHYTFEGNFTNMTSNDDLAGFQTPDGSTAVFAEGYENLGFNTNSVGIYSSSVNSIISPNNNWTIAFRCKASSQETSYATMFEAGETLYLRYTNNVLEVGFFDGSTWWYDLFDGQETDGNWHMHVLRFEQGENGTHLSYNMDGNEMANFYSDFQWYTEHTSIIFGSGTNEDQFNPSVKGLTGTIDDLLIFNSYLSNEDVATLNNPDVEPTGTQNLEKIELNVYPNPTTEWVTLDIPSNLIGARVSVVNVNGQVVLEELAKAQKLNLNVATLATGNYTVMVKNGETIFSSTLIKQ